MQRIYNLTTDKGMIYIDNPKDIFYLIGQKVSRGFILVFPDETLFFVDARYIDACRNINGVRVCLDDQGSMDEFIKQKNPEHVFVEPQTCSFGQYTRLKNLLPGAQFSSFTALEKMRVIKDESEIEKMKVSAALNVEANKYALSILEPGITEKQVAWEYEKFCKDRGAQELSFDTIVAFGKNSAFPHYHTGDTKLEKGMAVLIDSGITVDSYTSDMTRSIFYDKDAKPEEYALWKSHFNIVKESYDRAVAKIKAGETFDTLDIQVQDLAKEKGVEGNLRHTLGHSLGLDVHEWPRVTHKLPNIKIEKNMIFTIEPGLYFEDYWGIRYENTLWLSNNGVVNLSGD